jgi:hypothetical protein
MIIRFTIGPFKRKAWDSNPHDPQVARFSKPARQAVSGYLPNCQWTHRESNPDCQSAELESSRWTMSPCFCSGPDGNRTHHTDLARISRLPWYMPARVSEVRPGLEPDLPPYHGGVLPQHLQTIIFSDPGQNRTAVLLGVIQASSPLDHGIMFQVTEAGVEPADSQDLGLFALPVCVLGHESVAGPGVAHRQSRLMRPE